jgi:hypothetical protein
MVRPRDANLARELSRNLREFSLNERLLSGIADPRHLRVLVEQIIESTRRIRYVEEIRNRELSPLRLDPRNDLFDPLKAAIICQQDGRIEDAFWFIFLFVQFGKSNTTGWQLARDVYGALGGRHLWNWEMVSNDPRGFRDWLIDNLDILKGADGIRRHFGNHRKRESLNDKITGETFESYVNWVDPPRTHKELMNQALEANHGDSRSTFDFLYRSMCLVHRFGRTARFDYLTMVAKLDLAPIEPGSPYLKGSTGPLSGARLLVTGEPDGAISAQELQEIIISLERSLNVGMQAMEDSLCNWQKSPSEFIMFRG